jgi:hypothetical protein
MKTFKIILGFIEVLLGFLLGVIGILDKDTIMVVIGCMLIICGKMDLKD